MTIPAEQNELRWTRHLTSLIRVIVALLFFQHGAEKLWGFANGRVDYDFGTLRGIAGPIEVIGGGLLLFGLFTRTTAFILCGEMAVAYFTRWAPRGFFPIANGGEESVVFCFIFLWLVAAGAGPVGLDQLIWKKKRRIAAPAIASLEGYFRAILRFILAFTFSLHGFRHMFGLFPASGGRRGAVAVYAPRDADGNNQRHKQNCQPHDPSPK